jgi:Arc/MetJ family transcription regulator
MATHAAGAVRTNIVLDEALVEEAMEVTGARTKKEVVHLALEELIRSRKKKSLTDLAGRIRFRKDFDPKALRKLRG